MRKKNLDPMDSPSPAYTELVLLGSPEAIEDCILYLGDFREGELMFSDEALKSIAMDEARFQPVWSGVFGVDGGVLIWFTNIGGLSELAFELMQKFLFAKYQVDGHAFCIKPLYGEIEIYTADRNEGDELFRVREIFAKETGQEVFEKCAEEIFGPDWREVHIPSYCMNRVEEERSNYAE